MSRARSHSRLRRTDQGRAMLDARGRSRRLRPRLLDGVRRPTSYYDRCPLLARVAVAQAPAPVHIGRRRPPSPTARSGVARDGSWTPPVPTVPPPGQERLSDRRARLAAIVAEVDQPEPDPNPVTDARFAAALAYVDQQERRRRLAEIVAMVDGPTSAA